MEFVATPGNIIPTLHRLPFDRLEFVVPSARTRVSNLNGVDKALRKRAQRARRALLRGFRETRYFPRPRGNPAGCNYDHSAIRIRLGRELRRYTEYNSI